MLLTVHDKVISTHGLSLEVIPLSLAWAVVMIGGSSGSEMNMCVTCHFTSLCYVITAYLENADTDFPFLEIHDIQNYTGNYTEKY